MRLLKTVLAATVLFAARPVLAQTADSTAAAVRVAETVATSWLGLVDRGRYGESWDSAATVFRRSIAKPAWEDAIGSARRPLEPFGERTLVGSSWQTTLPNAPPGQYVVLQYRTRAGGGKRVIETVTPMKDSDGTWRVSGYYVRPE